MTLGELIQKQFGTKNAWGADSYQKQKELYQKLGNPLGDYFGSAAQNNYLLSKQNEWGNLLNATPQVAAPSAAQSIVNSATKDVKTATPFESLVNPTSVVNEDLINQFAQSQVNPDAYRNSAQAWDNYQRGVYQSGGQRFGTTAGQNLLNDQERQRQDALQSFKDAQRQNLWSFYNQQKEDYYKDPNAFQVNNFDTQLKNKTPWKNDPKAFVGSFGIGQGAYKPFSTYY